MVYENGPLYVLHITLQYHMSLVSLAPIKSHFPLACLPITKSWSLGDVWPNLGQDIVLSSQLFLHSYNIVFTVFCIPQKHIPLLHSSHCFCHSWFTVIRLLNSASLSVTLTSTFSLCEASFALLSADSFPVRPKWAGAHKNATCTLSSLAETKKYLVHAV